MKHGTRHPTRNLQSAICNLQSAINGMPRQSLTPYLVLLGGVGVVASAAIMIRALQRPPLDMPAALIAAGRLGLAAIILLPIAWLRVGPELRRLKRRDLLLGIGAGALLALHFDAWIASLDYTSVASSVALVSTNPLWVAVLSLLLWGERPPRLTLLGVLLAVAGSALIGFSDSGGAAPNALLGDGLALVGALAVSGYFLIGRELRRRLSLLAYIWLVYTSAAIVLLAVALVAASAQQGERWGALAGYPPSAYGLLLLLAVGPQLLGHSALNWALRYLSATFITVALLGEPIGAALLALLLFREWFAPLQLLGFVLLLAGIVAAARGERMQTEGGRGESNVRGMAH
jgi:drug/metabolite transporter (DMT)-like permease